MAALKSAAKPDFGKPPESQNELLKRLGEPHVASFNYMINKGMDQAIASIPPVEFLVDDQQMKLVISSWSLSEPQVPFGTIGVRTNFIYPSECRQRNGTYNGKLFVTVDWYVDGVLQPPFTKDLGNIPIMIKSNKCNLQNFTPEELVKRGEHEQEWGGYFIIGGLEKFIRMLMMTRRNYPIAIQRSGWKGRGTSFSDLGVSIRCVAQDQTASTNVLHYLTDGTAKFMFSYQKMIYFVPLVLILKCLADHVDYYIYTQLMEGRQNDLYFDKCCRKMLRILHLENLHSHNDCLDYLGSMFRVKLYECPSWYTNRQCAEFLLKNCILIHLDSNEDKFKLLIFMTQKLYSYAQNKSLTEGADAVMMQEVLQGGHLYLQVLKEKMQGWLNGLRLSVEKLAKNKKFNFTQSDMLRASKLSGTIESAIKWFLSTGSINSKTGLGLMQDKGLVIVAENINRMRYMSHFRAVHRGSFFLTMRTTEARQMLPDGWGFICPVHTPDGAPCGLLNHLTMDCVITDVPDEEKVKNIPDVMIEIGMWGPGYTRFLKMPEERQCYDVLLDGRHIGLLAQEKAQEVLRHLRLIKIKGERVPNTLEIAFVPLNKTGKGQYPGLFLFTGPSRLMRPVLNLHTKEIELIGSFEQAYLEIAVKQKDIYSGVTTHVDLSELTIMSNVARLIPMPDCNQSPRNMYQCQMGKQTMGTPCHNWDLQSETKLYRLQTPASPLFKPIHYDDIGLDDFAMGTNAIVAVITYTGYDMEDAIIINKASAERGFCHGSIYKSEFVELNDAESFFALDPSKPNLKEFLDNDGFAYIGREFQGGEPLYCYFDADNSNYRVVYFKGKETCFFHSVKLCGDFGSKSKKIACLTFRVPRNPSIGDKFASRAGQKGICSLLMPQEDLPFTESGLVPDIIFNPHGFPSRMTIAMMIELMAGKSGAIQGLIHDATPFKFGEDDTAIDFFGRLLERAGYDYYGTETMYSGTDGRDMQTDIFFGVVHYQRLRHMVADKWQVRSTGAVDISVRQPIKGRKRGGGVRFGEMERDALIAHGASYLLQDRLFNCSDKTSVKICTNCSSTLSPIIQATRKTNKPGQTETKVFCTLCKGEDISEINIPYIYKYITMHMATLCIDMQLETEKV